MKKVIVMFTLFIVTISLAQQQPLSTIEEKLEVVAFQQPGLNERVESEVTGLNLYTFISSLALEHRLNVDVDPQLNTIVESNYFDVPVKEVLLFLIKQHNIEVEFVNKFIVFKKRKEVEKVPEKVIAKPIDITYRSENEFLSVNLRNDSLPSVAEKITKESGRNVIVSPDAKNQKITGYFQNRPFDDIMDMIGQSNGLIVIKNENGSYFIQKDETPKEVKTIVTNSSQSSNRIRKGVQGGAGTEGIEDFYEVTISDSGFLNINAREANATGLIMEAAEKLSLNYYMYSLPTEIETTLVAAEISFEDLLNIVFRGKDFTYNQDASGVYFIGNRSEEGLRSTELIQLENRTIETVMNSIPTELKINLEIKEFPELNGLIVSGSKPKIEELRLFLYQIDKVVPMVQLEVFIVQYNKSHDIQTGLKAGLDPNGVNRVTSGVLFPTTDVNLNAESVNGLIDIFNGFGIFNLGKVTEQFYANLQFLENNSVIKLESTPKIATLSGHEATLTIGETNYYFEQNNSIFNTGINNTITQSGTWKPTEANLSVTIKPFVSKDEQITLKLRVEKNSFLGRAGENAPPGKATQSFDSEIRVKNNEMTLLGGLDELTRENSGTGVPFLARIPVIKWFFSGRAKKKSKSKLHILIKPTVKY
ncbi:type II secretion system protein GspD [Winogradskyella forsetii]|uniref:type II secretion system protein GspD n=1 Tax=Winogradskyella forsetii TaxID=2686077 RepID=UPI0015C124DB|nr:type II and III secretion system protein [Winogradskyella forsetii]